MKYVAAAAALPMVSMRSPPRTALRPENRLNVAPTTNKAPPEMAAAISTPGLSPSKNGMSGRLAPIEKAMNEETAAPIGEPRSSGFSPSSSRASIERLLRIRGHFRCDIARLRKRQSSRGIN